MLILKVLCVFKINRSFIEALFFFNCVQAAQESFKSPIFHLKTNLLHSLSILNTQTRTSLMVRWLRLPAVNVVGLCSIPDQGTRSHMPQLSSCAATKDWHSQINKKQMLKKMCRPASFTLMHSGLLFQMLRVSNEQRPLGGLKFEMSCEIHTRSTIMEHICRTLCQTSFCGHLVDLISASRGY